MHITLVHPACIPPPLYGGTERVIAWLATALANLGHSVTLISYPGSALPLIHSIALEPHEFDRWPEYIPPETDIVHLRSHPPSELKFPVIVTLDGNGRVGESFHPNTVFLSEKHAHNHRGEVFVHHGLPFDTHTQQPPLSPENYFVFLAKASWSVKNLKGAISVAKKIGIPLKVLGSRNYPFSLQRLTQKLSLPIQYYGMVNDAEKYSILSRAQGLFFPVRWDEPFGIAVIEAIALGVPVLGTPYGSLPEIVNSTCGFLSNSSEEWETYCRQKILLGFNRQECQKRIPGNFDSLSMAQKYLKLYEQIINGKNLHSKAPQTLESFQAKKLLTWK